MSCYFGKSLGYGIDKSKRSFEVVYKLERRKLRHTESPAY